MILSITNGSTNAQIISYDEVVMGSDRTQVLVNSVGGAYVTMQFDSTANAMNAMQLIIDDAIGGKNGSAFVVGDNGFTSYRYTSRIWNNVNRGI